MRIGGRGGYDKRALRIANYVIGLALFAHALFFLALLGQLRVVPVTIVAIAFVIAARRLEGRKVERPKGWTPAFILPAFVVALLPPLAFDETLYHLPFVRALASSGELRYLPDLRFPVFPQLHELLCVPAFWIGGDTATHLVALLEMTLLVLVLHEWNCRAGLLAAALLLGSPLIIHLATITYVDAALALFITTGFFCLDRNRIAWAGFLFGTACSVKYTGGFFAIAALVFVLVRSQQRWRDATIFASCALAAALPTTLWIFLSTGDPVFPFFLPSQYSFHFDPVPIGQRAMNTLRLVWDVTFARERVGRVPPVTPFLAVLVIGLIVAALRDTRARAAAIMTGVYVVVFAFLPQDSRYLAPLLPLLCFITATVIVARWPQHTKLFATIAIAPGIAYAIYLLAVIGLPPVTAQQREQMLARRIPEYTALMRAGTGTVYACGAERLKAYARGRFLGDHNGPYSFTRVLQNSDGTSTIAPRLERIGAQYFLVAKRTCRTPPADGGMDLVYEDAAAQLWRVQSSPQRR